MSTRPSGVAADRREGDRASALDDVLHDLVDTILAEDLAGVAGRLGLDPAGPLPLAPGERTLRVPLPAGDALVLRARPGWPRSRWRMSRAPVLRTGLGTVTVLDPRGVLAAIAELLPDPGSWPALPAVLADLGLAPGRAEAAARAAPECIAAIARRPGSLLVWERLAALRDRPFHPTARVRSGWTPADHDEYGPEQAPTLMLDWVAVRRDRVAAGSNDGGPGEAALGLLSPPSAHLLRDAVEAAGLDTADHVALPVHPWQRLHVLPACFGTELARGICTLLETRLGAFVPTSSVRTLAPVDGHPVHVKLPLGVASLGALRLLPPRYLHNGGEGQALLAAASAVDPALTARLRWCDERSWWVYRSAGVPEDTAGQLGCLIRRYPADLAGDRRCNLVPLAALGVSTRDGAAPAIAHLCRLLGRDTGGVLEAVARAVTAVGLSCFAAGLMPEAHGQNVVLAVRDGGIAAVVLRDHDTVRIHPPWLRRAGLKLPGYVVAARTPNTLVNDTPEALLAWFQTLTVQVALGAAVEAEAAAAGSYAGGWEAVAAGVRKGFADADLPPGEAAVARRQLFEAPTWPAKLVLAPLLRRQGAGGGSMPSGRGEAANPLLGRAPGRR